VVSVPRFAGLPLCIQSRSVRAPRDQRSFDSFPGLFAVFHALRRLLAPRHPPHALSSLAALTRSSPASPPTPTRPADGWTRPGQERGKLRSGLLQVHSAWPAQQDADRSNDPFSWARASREKPPLARGFSALEHAAVARVLHLCRYQVVKERPAPLAPPTLAIPRGLSPPPSCWPGVEAPPGCPDSRPARTHPGTDRPERSRKP